MYTGKICPQGVGRTKGEEGIDDDEHLGSSPNGPDAPKAL